MTQLSEQTKFAYAVARIRALEHLLIDRTTMMRLLDEPLPGVCRILEEKGYPPAGDYCGSIPESGDEAFISPAFSKLKDTLLARVLTVHFAEASGQEVRKLQVRKLKSPPT